MPRNDSTDLNHDTYVRSTGVNRTNDDDKEKYFHALIGEQNRIERLQAEIEVYKAQLHNIRELYINLEETNGLGPDQAIVKYLLRIITTMYMEAAK
jgi:hypothetical protein